jgi:DNA-binding transcriptional LysR family regulator
VVLSAAEAGLGIALARWPIVRDRLAEGRLVRCHPHETRHDVCYHLVTAPAGLREPHDPGGTRSCTVGPRHDGHCAGRASCHLIG